MTTAEQATARDGMSLRDMGKKGHRRDERAATERASVRGGQDPRGREAEGKVERSYLKGGHFFAFEAAKKWPAEDVKVRAGCARGRGRDAREVGRCAPPNELRVGANETRKGGAQLRCWWASPGPWDGASNTPGVGDRLNPVGAFRHDFPSPTPRLKRLRLRHGGSLS